MTCYINNGNTPNLAFSNLQETINPMDDWYYENWLSVNYAKCNAMLMSMRKIDSSLYKAPTLSDEEVDIVDSAKYLGLILDSNLHWDEQINYITKKVSAKLYVLKQLSYSMPSELVASIYLTCVQPHLEYACTVWGHFLPKDSNRIQRLQNMAARIVTHNYDYKYCRGFDIVRDLGWQTFDDRLKYLTCSLVFKALNGLAPANICNMFTMQENGYNTRSAAANKLHVPFARTVKFSKSLQIIGPQLWNQLDKSIRDSTTIEQFQSKYKKAHGWQ